MSAPASISLRILTVLAACGLLAGLAFTVYVLVRHEPHIARRGDWSIAIFHGPSPLELRASAGADGPAFTARDVSDLPARYVADPFLLHADDRWYLFFEVLDGHDGHGDIGVASSSDLRAWRYEGLALDEPFHLSYPMVFEHEGKRYMIPESAEDGTVRLYVAHDFPLGWRLERVLLERTLVDSTIVRHDGHWYLFGCSRPRKHDTLELFVSDSLLGPWREHPSSPVVRGDATAARPAGRFVPWSGVILRFAQDSAGTYGRAVNAFRIIELSPTRYAEEPDPNNPVLAAMRSGWARHGMHHVDAHPVDGDRWIAAVDGYRKILSLELSY